MHARIATTLRRLREDPSACRQLASLAAEAGLSPSRFQHLFKQATGVPFCRYRTWCRIGFATQDGHGRGLPYRGSLVAGFGSSAHFSMTFREMFGLSPTQNTIPLEAEKLIT